MWLMNVDCTNGFRLHGQKVILFPRNGSDEEQWTLDVASGQIIEFSNRPAKSGGAPEDSHSDLTGGKGRTLSSQIGINTAIFASSSHVFICNQQKSAAFSISAGRPREVSDFYSAVRAGELVKAQQLYPFWQKTRLFDLGGSGPLSVAAKEDRPKIIELLLTSGESPNSPDADGFAPLLMALRWNNPDIARLLLNAGADPNYKSHLWALPLSEAVEEGKRPIIEDLLRKGARVNSKGEWTGGTALHEAVMYRNHGAIETLLAAGADVHMLDGDGLTPSQKAPEDECVKYLFDGGKTKDRPEICQPPKRETVQIQIQN